MTYISKSGPEDALRCAICYLAVKFQGNLRSALHHADVQEREQHLIDLMIEAAMYGATEGQHLCSAAHREMVYRGMSEPGVIPN